MLHMNFPHRTTMGKVQYSSEVTNSINIINNMSTVWTIKEDLARKIPRNSGEDFEEYWDDDSENLCFGRYLELTTQVGAVIAKIEKASIKSWFGTDAIRQQINLIIWFEKSDIGKYAVSKLKHTFGPTDQYHDSLKEVWITMNTLDLQKFCDSACQVYNRQMIIKDFLASVLTVLK